MEKAEIDRAAEAMKLATEHFTRGAIDAAAKLGKAISQSQDNLRNSHMRPGVDGMSGGHPLSNLGFLPHDGESVAVWFDEVPHVYTPGDGQGDVDWGDCGASDA